MRLSPGARKFALTAHVAASVGWLGGVAGALALAIVGAASGDTQTAEAAYIALELIAWLVLVPLALASLATGLLQALGTPWGLFRHYWVVAKLVMNVVATIILLLYLPTLDQFADEAGTSSGTSHGPESLSPVLHAAAASLLLLAATALAIFKPRGLTPYGWRERDARLARRPAGSDDGERRR